MDDTFMPYIRRGRVEIPAADGVVEARREEVAQERERRNQHLEQTAGMRRELLTVSGVRDIEAAMACGCSCHPTVADLHRGGATCPCQLTAEERQAKRAAALAELTRISEAQSQQYEQTRHARDSAIRTRAEELDVVVTSWGGMAPYVLRGVVDGRAFFLRERHDMWRVEIAGDDRPDIDPWTDRDGDSIVVAEGVSDVFDHAVNEGTFFDVAILDTAVSAVRSFLQRRSCPHDRAETYCPRCGVAMSRRDVWRTYTTRVGGEG